MTATTEIAVRDGGALTIQADQTHWSEKQLAVLRSVGIEEDVTEAELDAFLHECQQRKLDPFSKQIYLIGRWDGKAQRKVYRSQTAIDGFRVIAHRAADETRRDLSYEDTMWCGYDGEWRDVWLSSDPPAAAKVVVLSNGLRFPAIATLTEYAAMYPSGDPMPMWKRMPSTMLAKCAEALALRKAFPDDLSGIYTAEEMQQADNPVNLPQPQPDRPAQRRGPAGPADDEWTRPAPDTADGIQDAEVVGETPQTSQPSPLVPTADQKQHARMAILLKLKRGLTGDDECRAAIAVLLNRPLKSRTEVTKAEARSVIALLSAEPDLVPPPEPEPAPLEDNPVRDVLLKLITDATTFAQLAEAARDIVAELARGNLTPAEADVLRAAWKTQQSSLTEAERAQMAGASS